jgi:hypothetical protein
MNLNDSPTIEQLTELLASVDDNSADHVLWVGVDGEVHIERFTSYVPLE